MDWTRKVNPVTLRRRGGERDEGCELLVTRCWQLVARRAQSGAARPDQTRPNQT